MNCLNLISLKLIQMSEFSAVITSDLHIRSVDKYGKINPEGLNTRLQDRLDNINKSINYAIEHEADYWICLGDVFDKINPAEMLRDKFIKTISPLIEHNISIIILIGNHDTDFKVHSFMTEAKLLNTLDSKAITIISEPVTMKLKGVECLFIPFTDDDDAITALLKKYKKKIVFGHFGVNGAVVSNTEYIMSTGVNQKLFDQHRFTI